MPHIAHSYSTRILLVNVLATELSAAQRGRGSTSATRCHPDGCTTCARAASTVVPLCNRSPSSNLTTSANTSRR